MRSSTHFDRFAPAVLAIAGLGGCGGGPTDPVPFQVVEVAVTRINPVYPQRDPIDAAVSMICHVDVQVDLVVPDRCTGFGRTERSRVGDTFSFTIFPATSGFCSSGGPHVESIGICLPGDDATGAPLPALPPGSYAVEVNGVRADFEIPG